jgi:hypothetical protein
MLPGSRIRHRERVFNGSLVPGKWNRFAVLVLHRGHFTPQERKMKKISYVLAALATIAIAAPSIASAEDKPMMKEGMMHHHHHHHHHTMKKMMKKDGM